jgi:hypothetical protein
MPFFLSDIIKIANLCPRKVTKMDDAFFWIRYYQYCLLMPNENYQIDDAFLVFILSILPTYAQLKLPI